ncbi:hypothetical protein [uncultured Shimia sp.]|uniref:hypothetical protein n=1 Tax=uncultured Shimia sp. TaxID=573152 RepID=UPI00262EB7A9|nr:hypothetical protein [uncultured Shimia sp.]
MKHPLLTGCLLLALSGCTEFSTMYQPGKTKTERNVDQAQCNRLASDRYPPRIVTDWWPIYAADGRVIGQRPESYDINEGPRYTAARKCMEERGYARVTIPYCKDEQIAGRSYAPITVAPHLSPNICGLRTDNGRVIIDLSKPL